MKYLLSLLLFSLLLLASCSPKVTSQSAGNSDQQLRKKANELAHRFIITDGHVDLPYRLRVKNFKLTKEYIGIPVETDEGDFDFIRAKKGGLDAPFMSVYIPASYQKDGGAKELADSLIDMVHGIIEAHPDKFAAGGSPELIQQNYLKGLVSLPMGMENGAPIGKNLSNVAYFHQRGIRYVTLTHSRDNQICDSSYDTTGTWGGLSPFGRDVVQEMNKVGMMIDVSHISDQAFYQVMELSKAPVIASHSSCRTFTPGFQRNMDDEMIKRLAKNGGVIQINFGSNFLDKEVRQRFNENRDKLLGMLAKEGLKYNDDEAKPIVEQFRKDHPGLFADVQTVVAHIDHVVQLVGADHVGFGSDFDGVGDSLPTGLKDVSNYPNIIYLLLKKGYSEEDIEKICYKNVFRVWNQVNKVAAG
ncbi:MAG: dipeptidase [Bacteroidota bacterium]